MYSSHITYLATSISQLNWVQDTWVQPLIWWVVQSRRLSVFASHSLSVHPPLPLALPVSLTESSLGPTLFSIVYLYSIMRCQSWDRLLETTKV